MDVSMDGLRKHLILNYNSLVKKLNSSIKDKSFDPNIIIDPDSIQKELDGLKNCIVTLAFTYQEGEGGWKEMPEDTMFEDFNQDEENDL